MKIITCLLCTAVASTAIAADDASWMSKIRPDHPRLFFNVDTWPAVKARALGVEKAYYEKLLKDVESYPDNPVCSGFEAIQYGDVKTAAGTIKVTAATPIGSVREWGPQAAKCAFAWRMTGKPEYLGKARKMLEVSIDAYHKAYLNRRAVNWYSTTRVLAICAYDWIHDGLTPEQRKAIIVPLLQHIDEVQPGPGKPKIVRLDTGDISTGFYGESNSLWFAGLAAYKDGCCDELAEKLLKQGYNLNQKLLRFRADSSGDDGGLSSATNGYAMGAYPWSHFNFMHTWLSATGENIAEKWPQLALFPNWIYWNWIPNFENKTPLAYGNGDDRHVDNFMATGQLFEHMTQYMHFFRDADPAAARLSAALRQLAPNKNLADTWPMYPYLLTSVDDVIPYSQAQLEDCPVKARHFESLGQIIMRSGWQPDSTYCLFTAGARLIQHKHHDENNFVIYKKGFLALDTGTRAIQTDYNLKYYYSQTVAHNCILIHKPNEPFAGYWGTTYNGPEGKLSHGGMAGYAGKMRGFATNEHFSYAAGDATKAYGDKCTEAVRQFIHLQPDYFIVYDRVGAADPLYKKEWLLHTQNKPIIDGKILRTDENKGRLFSETLLPKDAHFELVGGPGKEFWACGKNWDLDEKYLASMRKRKESTGKDPLFGNWRLEVSPAQANSDDRFLHVLTACEQTVETPVKTQLVQTDTQDGVIIETFEGKKVTILFNRTGAVAAQITVEQDGKLVGAYALDETIQPQAGIDIQ